MFATLGKSGVGKTVYLGMLLDMLSRQPKRMQLTARGGFSVTLQQNTLAALGRREFPTKTPNEPDRWNWVHGQLAPRRRGGHGRTRAARHCRRIADGGNRSSAVLRGLHGLLHRSDGVLVLIDGTQAAIGFAGRRLFHDEAAEPFARDPCAGARPASNRPVALVISKADQCESCFDDPAGYARTHAPGVWRICQKRFPRHRFLCGQRGRGLRCSTAGQRRRARRAAADRAAWHRRAVRVARRQPRNRSRDDCAAGLREPGRLRRVTRPLDRIDVFNDINETGTSNVLIEQAIFTSARTARADGYQLVAHSAGLSEAAAQRAGVVGALARFAARRQRPHGRARIFFGWQGAVLRFADHGRRGRVQRPRRASASIRTFWWCRREVLARFATIRSRLLRAGSGDRGHAASRPAARRARPAAAWRPRGGGRPGAGGPVGAQPRVLRRWHPGAGGAGQRSAGDRRSRTSLRGFGRGPVQPAAGRMPRRVLVHHRFESLAGAAGAACGSAPRSGRLAGDRSRRATRCSTSIADGASESFDWHGWAGFVAKVLAAGKLSALAAELEQPRPWLTCDKLDVIGKQASAALARDSQAARHGSNPSDASRRAQAGQRGHAAGVRPTACRRGPPAAARR